MSSDTDHELSINKKNLSSLLLNEICEPFTDEEITNVTKILDKEGRINFEDFLKWYVAETNIPSRVKDPEIKIQRATLQRKKMMKSITNIGNTGLSIIVPKIETRERWVNNAKVKLEETKAKLNKIGASKELILLIDEVRLILLLHNFVCYSILIVF